MEYKLEGDFTDAGTLTIEQLVSAKTKKTILQSTALLFDTKRTIKFDIGGFKGIMPFEEAVYSTDGLPVKDIAILSKIGQKVCFVIDDIDFTGDTPQLTLSRAKAQRMCCEQYLDRLSVGDIIDSRVTHVERYGAFCDVGCGVSGLLHIDCLSVSRISTPHDRVAKGERLRTVIKAFDDKKRVLLSLKELLGTWDENAACFNSGETVVGIVRSIEEYGIFIELAPNLSGLAEPVADLQPGQCVSVYIKSIIPEKMKVKLAIVGVLQDTLPAQKTRYFYDGEHMSSFNYASVHSGKNITTYFSE